MIVCIYRIVKHNRIIEISIYVMSANFYLCVPN